MPEAVDLGYALKLTPRRAVRYFDSKGYDTRTWNWWDTWQDAHAKSFTIAKAARLDVLTSINEEMTRALKEGITQAEFARELEPRLKKLGWWGHQVVVSPDGGAEVVQLGSPHRLKTIYRTNMRTAYAHGNYRQDIANVESRPYWMYVAVRDEHTRPEHAALDRQVFRWDDPFWDTHYPPNGFNCRCRVIALTAAEVRSMKLTVSRSKGHLTVIEQEVGTDKRSGEVIIRPATSYSFTGKDGKPHVLTPDPGWNYNPGKAQTLYDLERGPSGGALPALADKQPTWRDFSLPRITDTPTQLRLPTPTLLPKADNATAALAQLEGALAVPKTGFLLVRTPDGLDDVVVRREYLPHIVEKRAHARERYANWILPTLQSPLEVWLARHEDEVYRRRFIAAFGAHDNQSLVIAQENRDGSLLYNFVPVGTKKAGYLDGQRQGFLLYRRGGQ